jgi:hypothetical protein
MAKKQMKPETVGVRIPHKMRFSLDLMARKRGCTISALMTDAAQRLIDAEGAEVAKLWRESESERLLAMLDNEPNVMTYVEREMAGILDTIRMTRELKGRVRQSSLTDGQRIALNICVAMLDRVLLSPPVNDSFADDLLNKGGEFADTIELKNAVRQMMNDPTADKSEFV